MCNIKPEVLKPDGKRNGRGFSREELKKAGLNKAESKKLKIPFDLRIKAYAEKKKAEAKPKPKPKPKPEPKKKAKK
jgi:ribosomal protein L13E